MYSSYGNFCIVFYQLAVRAMKNVRTERPAWMKTASILVSTNVVEGMQSARLWTIEQNARAFLSTLGTRGSSALLLNAAQTTNARPTSPAWMRNASVPATAQAQRSVLWRDTGLDASVLQGSLGMLETLAQEVSTNSLLQQVQAQHWSVQFFSSGSRRNVRV
jgi:hypothetical protein